MPMPVGPVMAPRRTGSSAEAVTANMAVSIARMQSKAVNFFMDNTPFVDFLGSLYYTDTRNSVAIATKAAFWIFIKKFVDSTHPFR